MVIISKESFGFRSLLTYLIIIDWPIDVLKRAIILDFFLPPDAVLNWWEILFSCNDDGISIEAVELCNDGCTPTALDGSNDYCISGCIQI
jgi:hypothetical protein